MPNWIVLLKQKSVKTTSSGLLPIKRPSGVREKATKEVEEWTQV